MAAPQMPTADYILAMMNPYKLATTAESAKMGIAAGSAAAETKDRRKGMAQQKELALADDARAGEYLDLQKQQAAFGQKQGLNDRRMKAYAGFQSAVDAGDTEGADLAAHQLRMLGVDVQQYGQEGAGAAPASPGGPQPSPTEAVAQAQAQRAPMSPKDAQTSKELDALGRSATVDSGDPMQAVAAAAVPRPAPARAVPVETQAGPVATPEETPEPGIRPGPARERYIEGQEPAPAGEAKPEQGLIRGYRLSFDGQNIDIDPQSVQERQRQRVANSLAPLLQNASTPDEQRAAATAIQAAMASVGTLKPDEAIEYGIGLYKDPLDRDAKEKRARIARGPVEGYGGVEGLTEDEKKRTLEVGRYANMVINQSLNMHGVRQTREQIHQNAQVLEMVNSKDPMAQFGAKATLLKTWMKGALSDRDVARFESSPGQIARLESWINTYVAGGQIPPDVLRQMKEIAIKADSIQRRRLDEAGQAAKDNVMSDATIAANTTPEEHEDFANKAYGMSTGVFQQRKSHQRGGAPAKGAPARGAPAKGTPVRGSASERARKHGY